MAQFYDDAGMAMHFFPRKQGHTLELFQTFSHLEEQVIGDCTLEFAGIKQAYSDSESFIQDLVRP